jgi:hypothetical protein
MRFMMIVKASPESEAGVLPSKELIGAMSRYNEELVRSGVMLAADGLHPSSKGVRVTYSEGRPAVTDGPFAGAKELIAGFWLIQVKSREEAIEWASRVPFTEGEIEIRQIFEPTDFPADHLAPEDAEREQALREHLHGNSAR